MIGKKISDKKHEMLKKHLTTKDINNISVSCGMGKTTLQNLVYQRCCISEKNIKAYRSLNKILLMKLITLNKESKQMINELKKEIKNYD